MKLPGKITPSDFGPDLIGIDPEVYASMQKILDKQQEKGSKNYLGLNTVKDVAKTSKAIEGVLDSKIKIFVDRAILLAKKLGAIDENGKLVEEKLIKDSETGKTLRIKKFGKNPVMRFTNGKIINSDKPSQQAVEFMIHLSDNKLSNTFNSKLNIKLLKQNLSLFEIKKVINI